MRVVDDMLRFPTGYQGARRLPNGEARDIMALFLPLVKRDEPDSSL